MHARMRTSHKTCRRRNNKNASRVSGNARLRASAAIGPQRGQFVSAWQGSISAYNIVLDDADMISILRCGEQVVWKWLLGLRAGMHCGMHAQSSVQCHFLAGPANPVPVRIDRALLELACASIRSITVIFFHGHRMKRVSTMYRSKVA